MADKLVESVCGPAPEGLSPAWDAEIIKRIREIDEKKVETVPWEQVREELKDIIRGKPE